MADYDYEGGYDSGDDNNRQDDDGNLDEVSGYEDDDSGDEELGENGEDETELVPSAPIEIVEEEAQESLYTKLIKMVKKERAALVALEIAANREIKSLKTGEERFNPYHKGYDIGNVVTYRDDMKGGIKKGIIVKFDPQVLYVVGMKENDAENSVPITYASVTRVDPLNKNVRKETPEAPPRNASRKIIDPKNPIVSYKFSQWRKMVNDGKVAINIPAMQMKDIDLKALKTALKEADEKIKKRETEVIRTDELNIAEIYGTKPTINPFFEGYNIGRKVKIDGNPITWGYILDYTDSTILVRVKVPGVKGKYNLTTFDQQGLDSITFYENEMLSYPKIDRNTVLRCRISLTPEGYVSENIRGFLSGPDIPEPDLFGHIQRIVYGKWQNLLASIFPQEPQQFVAPNRTGFVQIDSEELYNSGSDFENWVLIAKPGSLNDMYFDIHGHNLVPRMINKTAPLENDISVLEKNMPTILEGVFWDHYETIDVLAAELIKQFEKYYGGDLIGESIDESRRKNILTLAEQFNRDFVGWMSDIGTNLIEHPHAIALYDTIMGNPENTQSSEKVIENINRVFILEILIQRYILHIKNEPIIGEELFVDKIKNERRMFLRWIYRNTIGAIESDPKYEKARRGDLSGLNREQKIWASYYLLLMAEYSENLPPSPFRNHSILASLEKLMDRSKENSDNIKEYLERVMCIYTLLSPPFVTDHGLGVCNYLREKVLRKGQAIWDVRVDPITRDLTIEHLLPEVFYSSNATENIKKLMYNVFKIHLEQHIDEVLFDIPYFKFSRGNKISYNHALALGKVASLYKTPVDRCIAESNTGVQPDEDSMEPWLDDPIAAKLSKIPPDEIVLCIDEGKFVCYQEKELVQQFLRADYVSNYTGKEFEPDFVNAVLRPYSGMKPSNEKIAPYGVIGESIGTVAKELGKDSDLFTHYFNKLSIKHHYIYIKGDSNVDILKTRLPPTPKTIYLIGLSTRGNMEAAKLISKMHGKIKIEMR